MTRVLDVALAALGLVLTSPLLALAAVGVKLTSAGPVLFKASRAGRDGKPFSMLKIRTMEVGADRSGPITASRDARVFPWGRLLRRLKVDELPQLINVLRGDMSMVGPRPEDIEIVRDGYTPFMLESLTVRPGITGPGSLSYFADESSLPTDPEQARTTYLATILPRKIALDLVYVRHRSVAYYGELVMRTVASIFRLDSMFAARSRWELATARDYLRGVHEGDREHWT
ncbi:sugar transferase [Phycicoccus endophyticus]|uniref:Sugar transferase n=1 Tax=Phycicoccus endophyticus TaxID=1690220 RepID=A0A7G9R2U2_9MICO|nr:sugar transferase [Phycicoccus endophyticus]NHI20387.1 sugar transferase [Phycicoccus endophyticus]QNN49917.1 sugar transferase [Phycicoccus endophyticus]GGL29628.1 glycosyl transferase [Phycicoccus endophyticus]